MTTPQLTDEQIDAVCAPGRAERWKGDGRQYDRDTARLIERAIQAAGPGDAVSPKPTQERNENFVPGVMHCAKCRFRLNRINLNVNVGTVTAGDNKTEPCPNGCGPLWPITWEQEAREGYAALEAMFERAYAAEQALAARPSSPVLQLVASKSGTKQGQDAAPAERSKSCLWSHADDDTDLWETSCGNAFSIIDGTPEENEFRHCCYCGGVLEKARAKE